MTSSKTRGRLLPLLLHFSDRIHEELVLKWMSCFWRIEARVRGCVVGQGVQMLGRPLVKLHPESRVTIENGAVLVSNQRRSTSGNLFGPCRLQTHSASSVIEIGAGVGLNGASIVARSRHIRIGELSMLAPNCVIMDSPYHRLWPPAERHSYPGSDLDQDVVIGRNCWLGNGCLVLPGAEIGDNAIIGARSVVNGKIPANCLAAGSPARVIRKLDMTPSAAAE